MRLSVQGVVPDSGVAKVCALFPFAGDFRNQAFRVLVHGVSPVRRRLS